MTPDQLRDKFIDFFKSKKHEEVRPDLLVPRNDPTLLFTGAGMNQFKNEFLGKGRKLKCAVSCQPCLRTGDIDNVGRTPYHHTFFEMLGNFSFGDYFKKEAVVWAWEFVTDKKWLGLDPACLSVSVYLDDDEAYDIWRDEVGLPAEKNLPLRREGQLLAGVRAVQRPRRAVRHVQRDILRLGRGRVPLRQSRLQPVVLVRALRRNLEPRLPDLQPPGRE